jgi:hypothetical protein
MPQKKGKKKDKKKKPRAKQVVKTIVQQALPYVGSEQNSGHQYDKEHVPFVNQQQQQAARTDSLVGDLVGKLINKIENDGIQQTQQYFKEVQPINNNNNVNVYNDGTNTEKKTDETPSTQTPSQPTGTTTTEDIAEAVSNGIRSGSRSAAEVFGIQTASSATALVGIGALGVAANSDAASKAKLK